MHLYDPTTAANDVYVLWEESPEREFAFGFSDAMELAHHQIHDRVEFARLLEGLAHSRYRFLTELRSTGHVVAAGVSEMPFQQFEALMFGPGAGGVHGDYASGFVSAFAALAPFVRTLH